MNYVVFFKYHMFCLLDNLCRLPFFMQQSDWNLKITLPSKINSFLRIYKSQIKLQIPLKKAVNASYKRFRAKRTPQKKWVLCWRDVMSMVTRVGLLAPVLDAYHSETLQKNTAAAYGWPIKFGEPSSFDLANGSTSWISASFGPSLSSRTG